MLIWTQELYQKYLEELMRNREEEYRLFQEKIIASKSPILGVRTPILDKLAKKIGKTDIPSFLALVENKFFEETLVEGMVLASIKEKEVFLKAFKKYLPKIDSWATCDLCMARYKIIGKNKDYFYPSIQKWTLSKDTFTSRVGLVLLMDYYLDTHLEEIFSLIERMKATGYYALMAASWLLSVALVKDYDKTVSFLSRNTLNVFVHNKAIQKARESRRITKEQKEALLKLKR